MKAVVKQKGVFDAKGKEIKVGTAIEFKGDELPAYLVGKAKLVGKTPVTNPADDDKTKKE